MERKYPVLKCTKELWEEIEPILKDWKVIKPNNHFKNNWDNYPYLLSNFGFYIYDKLQIGFGFCTYIESKGSLRYLVNNKEEFLAGIAKIIGKEYKLNNNKNMERINIIEKLKNCPKGFKLYSPLCGNVKLHYVDTTKFMVYIINENGVKFSFDIFGRYDSDFPDGECLLFPSKKQQDWNKFCHLEEGHRIMVSDDGVDWCLRNYVEDNLAVFQNCNLIEMWGYIVPLENFDFQTKNLKDNIAKSIV